MSYLFSFQGRINRAKIWLFILVTLAWEIAIGLVAVFGLSWTNYAHNVKAFTGADPPVSPAPVPWPDPVSGTGRIAVGVIALLILLYFVALLAVYTKRLHDRNKNAWWLLPFVIIPWGLTIFHWAAAPNIFAMGPLLGPLGMGPGMAYLVSTILGLWAFIELFFFRGTAGENRFGPDPLG
jgi:uncharacterized membrane protein YhaH (DUF805 family)